MNQQYVEDIANRAAEYLGSGKATRSELALFGISIWDFPPGFYESEKAVETAAWICK